MERIRRLRDRLNGELAIITNPQHIFYLTNFKNALPSLLLIDGEGSILIGPSSMADAAGGPEIRYEAYTDYDIHRELDLETEALETAKSLLSGKPRNRVWVEKAHFPFCYSELVRHAEIADATPVIHRLRRKKDETEIGIIRRNMQVNDEIFRSVALMLTEGLSAKALYKEIQDLFVHLTSHATVVDGCLGAGPYSDNPDAQPQPYLFKNGDHFFLDLYPKIDGYFADSTRVFALGEPDAGQNKVFSILAESLSKAESLLTAGVPCKQVDAIVRMNIERCGYGNCFPHHTGHGFGMSQQEGPYLTPGSGDVLEAGDIVAVEPGIYIPGWGGMRLESAYRITNGKPVRLDQFDRDQIHHRKRELSAF